MTPIQRTGLGASNSEDMTPVIDVLGHKIDDLEQKIDDFEQNFVYMNCRI